MARYVVLSFSDNDDAEAFIEHSDGHSSIIHQGKVVGMYAQPTVFCPRSGSGGCGSKNKRLGWARGKKYGWWVCAECGKPSNANLNDETLMRNVVRNGVNFLHQRIISQAINLLDPDPNNVATVNDEGWGAHSNGRGSF